MGTAEALKGSPVYQIVVPGGADQEAAGADHGEALPLVEGPGDEVRWTEVRRDGSAANALDREQQP